MARVKIEEVVDHLSSEMRSALQDAVQRTFPGQSFDPHYLFREFRSAVGRKCTTWERVPDRYIEKD